MALCWPLLLLRSGFIRWRFVWGRFWSASQVIRLLLALSLLPVVLTAATWVLFAIFKTAIAKGLLGTSRPLLSTTIGTALATFLAMDGSVGMEMCRLKRNGVIAS